MYYEDEGFSDEDSVHIKSGGEEKPGSVIDTVVKAEEIAVDTLKADNFTTTLSSENLNAATDDHHYDRSSRKAKKLKEYIKKQDQDLRFVFSEHTDISPAIEIVEVARLALRCISESSSKSARDDERTRLQSMENSDATKTIIQVRNLQEELRLALCASEDIKALKSKVIQLMEQQRKEKEGRLRVEANLQHESRKVELLSDHVEKLMTHLTHEAMCKVKSQESCKRLEQETSLLRAHITALNQKLNAKDIVIGELKEGGRVLEDQLRLMDDKFLELRSKLDVERLSSTKRVRRAESDAHDLRVKFSLAAQGLVTGSGFSTRGGDGLDFVSVPMGLLSNTGTAREGTTPHNVSAGQQASQFQPDDEDIQSRIMDIDIEKIKHLKEVKRKRKSSKDKDLMSVSCSSPSVTLETVTKKIDRREAMEVASRSPAWSRQSSALRSAYSEDNWDEDKLKSLVSRKS